MKRSIKGAIAAGAAGVLLTGGAGSLAYWTAEDTTAGTSVNSGHLALTTPTCGLGWTLNGVAIAYTNQLLVPGDVLTQTCDYVLNVAGANLTKADFTVTVPTAYTGAQALIDEIGVPTIAVTRNLVAQPTATAVTVTNNDAIKVAMTVTWPYGVEDNGSNVVAGLNAVLSDVTVNVKQNNNL